MWPIAVTGTVKWQGNPVLPIVRVRLCPATVTVTKTEYPEGVILLNDYPPPESVASQDFAYIEEAGESVQVDICANAGWPWCNIVILWK